MIYNRSGADFGKKYEDIFESEILSKSDNIFKATAEFKEVDFIGECGDYEVLIELKSRKHSYGSFDTTIIPVSKIEYYRRYKPSLKYKRLFCVFAFIDTNNTHSFYYIKYDPKTFKSLEIKPVYNDPHYYIPISLLTPCDNLINRLDKYGITSVAE